MSTLLVWREKLQRIYALYSIYIQKGLQFVTGLVLFWVINSNIGFMKPASSVFCTLGLAVICTFLPMTITVLAATALILAHFYALSLPIALVALVIFILMYISSDDNYRFSGDSIDTRTFLCVVASDCACGARHFYFNVYFLFSFYPEKSMACVDFGTCV